MSTDAGPDIISYYGDAIHAGVCMHNMPNGVNFSKYIEEQQFTEAKKLSSGYFSDTFLIETSGFPSYVLKFYSNKRARKTYYKELAMREMNALIAVKNNPYATKLVAAQIESARAFFLLSYVPGVTLTEWLMTNPTLVERREKIDQIKAGIAAIHADNIIHADIKEDNIWIPNPDQISDTVREVVFLDFGLAFPPNRNIRVEGTTAVLSQNVSRSNLRGTTYTPDVNHQLITKLEERILSSESTRRPRIINGYTINSGQPMRPPTIVDGYAINSGGPIRPPAHVTGDTMNRGSPMQISETNLQKPYKTLEVSDRPKSNEYKFLERLSNMSGGGSRGKGMHIKLLLIRHSKSCANLIREHGSRVRHTHKRRAIMSASQKVRDPGLTKIGRRMAESYGPALRAKAQEAGFDLDTATIGSSALRRAKETAALLFPTAERVVFPHLTEHGRIPENTPKRHAHTRPDWNAFLRHLRVDRATSEQATAQFIVVGHGSYLREVWRQLTGRSWTEFHNLDAFVIEGNLDVWGRLTVGQADRMPYTGLAPSALAKGAGDQCLLARVTRKIKRRDR